MNNLTSVSMTQGLRQYMEDTVLIDKIRKSNNNQIDIMAVFDGHGGSQVSEFCKNNFKEILTYHINNNHEFDVAIQQTYKELDLRCENLKQTCGSTALTMFKKKNEIWVANCGDSEAIVKTRNGNIQKISQCHKVENEKARLSSLGAQITYDDGCARINRMLNVARSFGDYHLKKYVISLPYIRCIRTDKFDIEYIVLASDGVWDVYDLNTLTKDIEDMKNELLEQGKTMKQATDIICYEIVRRSILRGSTDNISVILHIF